MKTTQAKKSILKLSLAIVAGFGLAACDVEKTQEGDMPEVDVKGGQMPKYDVDAPDVDVKMKEKDVTVKVPDIDVTPAKDDSATDVNE